MKKYICNQNILVRFTGLYIIGLFIFITAWVVSYYFLPEGVMRDTSLAAKLAGNGISASFAQELLRIFIINALMATLIIAFNFSFRINSIPLGYVIPPVWFLLYGLILGSNSFSVAMTERMGPSLSVLQRSGLYELAAYTLITVSTYNISRFEIKELFKTNPERIDNADGLRLQQYVGLVIALVVLFISNSWETFMLFNS